jgi:small subunit ribosomal protein S6e
MPNFKIVASDPKTKKAYQKEIEQANSGLIGKKIGEQVDGGMLGMAGYKLEITGGSDKDGFPMRKDVDGIGRKRIILASGPGFHPGRKGERKRKSIRGNTISADTAQVNTKIISYGQKSLDEIFGVKEKKKEETKKEEAKPAEAKKAESVKEETKQPAADKKEIEKEGPKEKPAEKREERAEARKEEHPPEEKKDEQKTAEKK